MSYRVHGRVRRNDNGQGIPNLTVRAYDVDWISSDDFLGSDKTDNNGNFEIRFSRNDFDAGWFDPEGGPDIILRIWNESGELIHETFERSGAGGETYFDIHIDLLDLLGVYTVLGNVRDARSGRALCNLNVEAWDDDWIFDDYLGKDRTNINGFYKIAYGRSAFGGLFDRRPDVYVRVKNDDGEELSRSLVRRDSGRDTIIDVDVGGVERSRSMAECVYSWTAAYRQEGTHIIVRIQLVPDTGVTAQQIQNLSAMWEAAIENKWSNAFACCCSKVATSTIMCKNWGALTFDVQWVNNNPHHTVTVSVGPGQTNMLNWDTADSGDVASHEFGHMIGLVDEYQRWNCPNRSPVNTGTVMDDNTEVVERLVEHLCAFINENAEPIIRLAVADIVLEKEPLPRMRGGASQMQKARSKTHRRLLSTIKKIISKKKQEFDAEITLVVEGGVHGQSVRSLVEIRGDGKVKHKVIDELKGKDEEYSTAIDRKAILNLFREIQRSRILEIDEIGGGFLPDSLVGAITIEIDGESTTYYYLADPKQRRRQKIILKQPIALIENRLQRVASRAIKRDEEAKKRFRKSIEEK